MNKAGLKVEWGVAHKRGGILISRQAYIESPGAINCVRVTCLVKYIVKSLRYVFILLYHRYRTEYAEMYPMLNIPWKYRTGENYPENIKDAIWEIVKLRTRRIITWLSHKRPQMKVMENSES